MYLCFCVREQWHVPHYIGMTPVLIFNIRMQYRGTTPIAESIVWAWWGVDDSIVCERLILISKCM